MKMPFRKPPDESPGDSDDFTEAMLRAQGIDFSSMIEALTTPAWDVASLAAWVRKQTAYRNHVVVQNEAVCCAKGVHDGVILFAPTTEGYRRIASVNPAAANHAWVGVYAVDEHSGKALGMQLEAEAMKRLMNALPGLIKAAEEARDEAAVALADER